MSTTPTLRNFVSSLINEKGLDYLEGDERKMLEDNLLEQLDNHLKMAVFAAIPNEKKQSFLDVLKKDAETAQKFVADTIDVQTITNGVVIRFREAYLAGARA